MIATNRIKLAIIDTGGANLSSLLNAFERLNVESIVATDRRVLDQATHLILPGVGHAKVAETKLKETELVDYIKNDQRPILGICLGFQLLYSNLEEGSKNNNPTKGLNILNGTVKKMIPSSDFNVPHMGWSQLDLKTTDSKLLKDISSDEYFYFVHSYATPTNEFVTSTAKNQIQIPATLEYKNFYATQFHPEKSGLVGEKLLKNFLSINELKT